MFSQEPAPSSGFVKFMTAFVFVVFGMIIIGFALSAAFTGTKEPSFAAFIIIFIIVFSCLAGGMLWICYRQKPRAYKIMNGEIIVERAAPWQDIHVNITTIKSLEIIAKMSLFSLRVWGNGGLFCVSGTFYSFGLGKYRASVTSIRNLLLIRYDNRALLISPAQPEILKQELERLTGLVTTG